MISKLHDILKLIRPLSLLKPPKLSKVLSLFETELPSRNDIKSATNKRSIGMDKLRFSEDAPSDENALKLFPGQWTSQVPQSETLNYGINLFQDDRIKWLHAIYPLTGKNVIELGPLEGAHTYMLENFGSNVISIENNYDAFLRSLIIKNRFDLKAKFLLGDFNALDTTFMSKDLVVASGVLYHQTDPVGMLEKMSEISDNLFIWTHYFDEQMTNWNPAMCELIGTKFIPNQILQSSRTLTQYRFCKQYYQDSFDADVFSGGSAAFSYWFYRDDLIKILGELGYNTITENFVQPNHPNGPSFALFCQRS